MSHLTTLVKRFLKTLEQMKGVYKDELEDERLAEMSMLPYTSFEGRLKHHVCNIMEYAYYDKHHGRILQDEIDELVDLLEGVKREQKEV